MVKSKQNASAELQNKYQKMSQKEHVLTLPDTYIGSCEKYEIEAWVFDEDKLKMEKRNIQIVPGFFKIFDEILVNAYDQYVRTRQNENLKPVKEINVTITEEIISVKNDGEGIDVAIHPEHEIYIPELIFANLLTSTNYHQEGKITGGKNGLGSKLTSLFSKEFTIETIDHNRKKQYIQTFRDNLDIIEKPNIKAYSKKPYTQITFKPDFKRFGMDKIDKDTYAFLCRRVVDMIACTDKQVSVTLNEKKFDFKQFDKYCDLYLDGGKKIYQFFNDRWEVCVALSPDDKFEQISFVNGINTIKGGKHIDYLADTFSKKIAELIKEKKKGKMIVKPSVVRDNMWVFARTIIEDPAFDSQTKEYLTTPPVKFGSKITVDNGFIEKIAKLGIMDKAIALTTYKDTGILTKTDGKKQTTLKGIPKLDDANWAGTEKSEQCTLILTEGDSAKAFAIAGLSVIGRDKYGVFPLKGKLINPRDVSEKKLAENEEVNNLKKILGLQQKKKYEDRKSLRYGSIMALTDADVDGSHIKGLIINLFHTHYKSLLQQPNFCKSMATPIVKATKGSNVKEFYTLSSFEKWCDTDGSKGWTIKYYKGLGTSSSKEAKEYFNNLDKNLICYKYDDVTDEAIELAFAKENSDKRKEWLMNYDADAVLDQTCQEIPIPDFIHKDLIHFSKYDCERSVPCMIDGFKPSHRKVIFSVLKRNITKDMKVAQLAAYIAENSAYHHGEKSLEGTIIGLAHDFVGSNNINLLVPQGQFGGRLQGGKDHASSRYIFTRMNTMLPLIYHPDDSPLLNYLEDDGKLIEPQYYIPIIPMILVNGGDGIGTGFSCKVPQYNPLDIIENLRNLMSGKELNDMTPWFRGFIGEIDKEEGKYVSKGIFNKQKDKVYEITELPVGIWTDDYKEYLDKHQTEKGKKSKENFITSFQSYYTEATVHFIINTDGILTDPEKQLKLKDTRKLGTSNMHLFNEKGQIKRYNTINDIFEEFYILRLSYYQKRKDYKLNELEKDIEKISAKVRFILGIIEEKIDLRRKEDEQVNNILIKMKFPKIDDTFDYLTSMPLRSLTKKRLEELMKQEKDKQIEYDALKSKTIKQLWKDDLNVLEKEYKKQLDVYNKELEDIRGSGTMTKIVKKIKKVKKV